MLNSATMRFCTDIFGFIDDEAEINFDNDSDKTGEVIQSEPATAAPFNRQALLISKKAWDCTNKIGVTGFNITEYKPSGTKIRMVFKIDNKYWKFKTDGSGQLEEYTKDITATNIIKSGNYPATLYPLTDIPAFVGKKIYPVVALQAPSTAEDVPAVKMGLKVLSAANSLSTVEESLVYELAEDTTLPRIIEISQNVSCTGEGEVTTKVRLRDAEGKWGSYIDFADAVDQEAAAVQFKFTYKVSTPESSDSARVNFVTVKHTFGRMIVSGEDADLYTTVQSYTVPLQMCYVVVRHAPFNDSKIEAYVNFMHTAKKREMLLIGRGTGGIETYVLGKSGVADKNIDTSTIQIYDDAKQIANFSYNSEVGTVTCTAKNNDYVYASYEYDHDVEVWRKMTLDSTEPYNGETGDCATRFVYSLSDSEAADKVVSNIRLKLIRPTGTVTEQNLGTGLKRSKIFVLPHIPKASTISFTDDRVSWKYNEDNNTLIVTAAKTVPMVVSYKWQGEPIQIYSLAAGWSVA